MGVDFSSSFFFPPFMLICSEKHSFWEIKVPRKENDKGLGSQSEGEEKVL